MAIRDFGSRHSAAIAPRPRQGGARQWARLLLLAAALVAACTASGPGAAVHELTAATFEHDTQAATGQTTGHWLVLFVGGGSSPAQAAAERAWDELAAGGEDEAPLEHTALFAKVDVGRHPEVGRRFGLSQAELPAAILLRDRQMYRLPLPLPEARDACAHAAMDFLAGGWQEADGEEVPPESAGRGRGGAPAGAAGRDTLAGALSNLLGVEVDAQDAQKIVALGAGFVAVAMGSYLCAGGSRGPRRLAAQPLPLPPQRGPQVAAGAAAPAASQAGGGAAKRLSRKDRSA
ncbi:hypothetical protein Rsub_09860 [Raphidocelis subcapitata]|uniref:Uncharacterized protein n=1 Tax=Raphidocelis subcapitata TaxID=307507 RepID=A0A2V0P9I5_9CHLO|nr:hypothetical protein Rsub_09860 [Raphidocelis subcapitata]|eukprot:GBF96518.1 hypothetical protein Rsub_09860 [Raphidocelis subcapitata]